MAGKALLPSLISLGSAARRKYTETLIKLLWARLDFRRFGFLEALCFSPILDIWSRYSAVLDLVGPEGPRLSLLDVGGGPGTIAYFLAKTDLRVTVADRDEEHLRWRKRSSLSASIHAFVAADGIRLPFADASFDYAVSLDTLEHLARPLRRQFAEELMRVARRRVILHIPAVSRDGAFRGGEFDERFQRWFQRIFKRSEPNVREHAEFGLPSIEELKEYFPGADIKGHDNGGVWLKAMILGRLFPLSLLVPGLIYASYWRYRVSRPPYYCCLLSCGALSTGSSG